MTLCFVAGGCCFLLGTSCISSRLLLPLRSVLLFVLPQTSASSPRASTHVVQYSAFVQNFFKINIHNYLWIGMPCVNNNWKNAIPPKKKMHFIQYFWKLRPVHLSLSEDFSVVSPERNCLKLVGWSWESSATPAALNLMYVLILVGVEAADIELVGMILGICGGIVLLLLLALLICILCRR